MLIVTQSGWSTGTTQRSARPLLAPWDGPREVVSLARLVCWSCSLSSGLVFSGTVLSSIAVVEELELLADPRGVPCPDPDVTPLPGAVTLAADRPGRGWSIPLASNGGPRLGSVDVQQLRINVQKVSYRVLISFACIETSHIFYITTVAAYTCFSLCRSAGWLPSQSRRRTNRVIESFFCCVFEYR